MVVEVAKEVAARIEVTRIQDNERLDWMNKFQAQLTSLTQRYEDACKDAERERVARSQAQVQAETSEHRLQSLQQCVNDASFVLVLIDADANAYMFQHKYYRNTDRGQKAALDLQAKVGDYLKKVRPDLARLPVVIKAFANVYRMSKFLVDTSIAHSPSSLSGFAKEFSQATPTSDFVLVGHRKDRADKKIKGVFEQFVRNPTCCHIIFRAYHDNSYVRMLEDFALDSTIVEQVTLLHSFSVSKEFKKLPFQSTKMDTVFRTAPPEVLDTPMMTVSRKRTQTKDVNLIMRTAWTSPVDIIPVRHSPATPERTHSCADRTI